MNFEFSEEVKKERLARFLRLVHTRATLEVIAGRLSLDQAWEAVWSAEDIRAESLPFEITGAAKRWVEVASHDFEGWDENWIHAALKGREYKEPYTP
jgi:hypothetical protein